MPLVLQDSTVTGNMAVGDAGDAGGDASGRQLDGFVVTFDRPVDPSGPAFDAQGRLLIGTDDGIWSGDPGNLEVVVKVLNAQAGTERESGLVYSGESGGINEIPSQTGHFTQMVWAETHSSSGQLNPPWGLDRIDQRAADGAPADSFAFEPTGPRKPPGELPDVIILDPAGDDERLANTDGDTGDGSGASQDSFVVDGDAGTVPVRQAVLQMFTASYCGTGVADDGVHLPGTPDALAPTGFFFV